MKQWLASRLCLVLVRKPGWPMTKSDREFELAGSPTANRRRWPRMEALRHIRLNTRWAFSPRRRIESLCDPL